MSLNPQTSNFPPIHQTERSWEQNLRAVMNMLVPGVGVRSGLNLDIPASGLTPTISDGVLISGDNILGPYAKGIVAAEPSATRKLFFGLAGFYYATTAETAKDAQVGEVTTNANAIVAVGQPLSYGACRFGVRGVINLARATKGADTTFFNWVKPDLSLKYTRVTFAMVRSVVAAVGAGAGDNHVLKVDNKTLVTASGTNISAANTIVTGTPDASWVFGPDTTALAFKYNQTGAGVTEGKVEIIALIECF